MANGRIRIGYPDPSARVLTAAVGSYLLSGQAADLSYSGAVLDEYDHIDSPTSYTDHWMDPAKAVNGLGTFADPWQSSQVFAFNPAGGRHRIIVLPGDWNVTGVYSGDSKMPFLNPEHSGTEANPVILKAQYASTNSSTTAEQLTIIRRTSGAGSIIGTPGTADHWLLDGFKFEGTHGGGGNENAHIVLRSCSGWQLTRFWIDDEFASYVDTSTVPDGSTNGGGVYLQLVDHIVVKDFLIENLGSTDPDNLKVWQPIEMYDATDCEVSYGTIRNVWGIGVHMKGAPAVDFQRNLIHHLLVDNCEDGGINPYVVQAGTDPADHNYWWNIVVSNCPNHAAEFNFIVNAELGLVAHQGTHFQNITFVNTGNSTIMFRPVQYTQYISIRNCVLDDSPKHIEFSDAFYPSIDGTPDDGYGNAEITWDYNRYNNFSNIDESASGSDSTLAAWRTRTDAAHPATGWDDNSDTTTHTYAGGGSYVTHSSVAADRPDTHNLYGGGNVRVGAWEPVGHRPSM